jgi:hypothetical protein
MKTRSAMVLISTAFTLGMASPSWAQGSLEHDDNGGGHPGGASGGYYQSFRPHVRVHRHVSRRHQSEQPRTQDSSIRQKNENSSPNGAASDTHEGD